MGSLSDPRTAYDFARAGVVFKVFGGETTCAGPRGRTDLQEALRREVERRVAALRPLIAAARKGRPVPRLTLLAYRAPRAGVCGCCGDPLPRYRGGDCALCRMALVRALKAEGRLR